MSSYNRRATRASGRAILSGSMQDVIRDARNTALYEIRAFREQKYESKQIPRFHPFMKLPLELRASIYFLAMEDADSPRHLATLRAPTLALVSKQVREEAMSVFLSRCTFHLNIVSNYEDMAWLDELVPDSTLEPLYPEPPNPLCDELTWWSGRAEPLSKRIRSRLQKMQGNSDELFFPHVEMHIRRNRYRGGRRFYCRPTLVLSLRAYGGRLSLDHKSFEYIDEFQPGLDQVRSDAETVARDIATRHERHKGFCYEELEAIAKPFRYWPPGAPEIR